MEKAVITCTLCKKEVTINVPGIYTDILSCGHITTKVNPASLTSKGINPVQAVEKSTQMSKISELPKIDGNELISRILSQMNQDYESFFNAENPIIQDLIEKHGKDNTSLILTAIVSHLSKVLFVTGRFKNLYLINLERLRKEVEDAAVKELIASNVNNYSFDHLAPKPKKIKAINGKSSDDVGKAKKSLGGLTTDSGKPIDITKFMSKMMWNSTKDKEKQDYKAGLDKIKESISKDKE